MPKKNPSEALRVALPPDVLAKIPDQLQPYFEKNTDTEGEIEVVYECDGMTEVLKYFIKTAKEHLPVYLAKQPEKEIQTGSKVRVKGIRIGDAVLADDANNSENLEVVESVLANPTVAASPTATQWIGAGSAVSYNVTITNKNSSGCAANTFNLQTALPSGWNVSAAADLSVAPGASVTQTVQVFSPSSASAGFYAASLGAANAANSGFTSSVSASLAVYNSLATSSNIISLLRKNKVRCKPAYI